MIRLVHSPVRGCGRLRASLLFTDSGSVALQDLPEGSNQRVMVRTPPCELRDPTRSPAQSQRAGGPASLLDSKMRHGTCVAADQSLSYEHCELRASVTTLTSV